MIDDETGFVGDLAFLHPSYQEAFFVPQLNETVPTAEHAYQAFKTEDASERSWLLEAWDAREARRRGFRVTLREDWNRGGRLWAMLQVVSAKFTVPTLEQALYATGSEKLVHYNDNHEHYFGVCTCAKHGGTGENMLGELLMMRRALKTFK